MFSEYIDRNDLLALLALRGARIPFPPAADRAAWDGLPRTMREEIARAAAEEREKPYPMLTATHFLGFVRDGDRRAYEVPFFARRRKLMAAVLAVCVGEQGDLAAVIDGIWCICEESFWGVSAHNGSSHPAMRPAAERPLPDVENPYVDLFAAQTAALLSWSCYLLGDTLDGVSPLLVRRTRREVEWRVIAPFFHHDDFWWMGMIRRDVNNWTPWILSNVMASLLVWERDDRRLCEGLARAMRMLDAYLAVMPEDGGCDEGTAYWNMAGGSLLDCLELLWHATGGRVSFYQDQLIREIGAFPLRAHIAGAYFWNFADCDALPVLDGERVYRYGARTGNADLAALGAYIAGQEGLFPRDTPEFSRALHRLFFPPPASEAREPAPQDITLPHLGVGARIRGRLYAAFKGGHNGENHNHNDVGSFLLYIDGQPAVIDLGNMVYTAKTFSPERYALPNTRSGSHNVPLIGDVEQAAGAQYAARNVEWLDGGVRMDIAGAYPEQAGLRSLLREAVLTEAGLTLTDEVALDASREVTWVFMLRDRPEISEGAARSEWLSIRFDASLVTSLEEISVTDVRMSKSFPGSVWRFALTAPAAKAHTRRFVFAPDST